MKADRPASLTPHSADAETAELPKKRIGLSYFFVSIPLAGLLALIPVPTIRCAESLGWERVVPALYLLACGLAFYGWRTQRRRYVIEATLLLWFAADLYWLGLVLINRVVSPPPYDVPRGWWNFFAAVVG